ncbi:kelch domain-containing protein 3-like [Amblyomma americanum]
MMWTLRLLGVPEGFSKRVVAISGKAYFFERSREAGTHALRNPVDVFIFDIASYQWHKVQTELPNDEPTDISRSTVVAYGQCAYLWGRPCNGALNNLLYRFDPNTLTWSRPQVTGEVLTSLYRRTACVVGNRMYIFCITNDLLDTRALDLDTMEWHRFSTSGEAPGWRSYFTASVIGTRIYVWGGAVWDPSFGIRECENTIYYLETTTSTWVRPRVQGVPPVAREGHAALVYKEELYIFGGLSLSQGTYCADMHKYDPETSCWTEVRPRGLGPSPGSSRGYFTTGERVFVFGGVDPVLNPEDLQVTWKRTDLHVLHLDPTLQNLCILAVIDARLDISSLPPIIRKKINDITSHPTLQVYRFDVAVGVDVSSRPE